MMVDGRVLNKSAEEGWKSWGYIYLDGIEGFGDRGVRGDLRRKILPQQPTEIICESELHGKFLGYSGQVISAYVLLIFHL